MSDLTEHDWSIHQHDHLPVRYSRHESRSYLINHLSCRKLTTLTNRPRKPMATDKTFHTNEDFWGRFLRSTRYYGFQNVILSGFRIFDWFPRSPGLSYTLGADEAWENARNHLEAGSSFVYTPEGKEWALKGGIGSYRFNPFSYQGTTYCLGTASSSEFCHSGIPLAIPMEFMENLEFRVSHKIVGHYQPIAEPIAILLPHNRGIPKFYFLVEEIERINPLGSPSLITPVVLMRRDNGEELVSYCSCNPDDPDDLNSTSDWLQEYAHRYDASIITDYDQQNPAFIDLPFSLQNVMGNKISYASLIDNGFSPREAMILNGMRRPIVNNKYEGNINFVQGNNSGNLTAATNISNSFNPTTNSIPDEAMLLFEQLGSQIDALCKQLSTDEAAIVKQDLDVVAKEAAKEKPSKKIFEIKFESLKKAAENVAELAGPIALTAGKLLSILLTLAK